MGNIHLRAIKFNFFEILLILYQQLNGIKGFYMDQREIISFLEFEDVINQDPNNEPYVILEGSESIQPDKFKELAIYGELTRISTIMIPTDLKERALDEIEHYSLPTFSNGNFEHKEEGQWRYDPGESWEYNEGLKVEPLIIKRSWSGLDNSFIEPTQRLVLYLNLLKEDTVWIDPYNNEEIIKVKAEKKYEDEVSYHVDKIEIKIDYLKDYLAARNSGLLFIKFSMRGLIFDDESEIPHLSETEEIPYGNRVFYSSKNASVKNFGNWAEEELRQKFWIEPLPEPKRDDARPRGEFIGGVPFTLKDGTEKEYDADAGHNGGYFELISFKSGIMEVFTGRSNFDYVDETKETLSFIFPNGESLAVGINPSGQIQSFWGQIAKLSKKNQIVLAAYSEPWKQKLPVTHEYYRTSIRGLPASSRPIKTTIQEKKTEINQYFDDKFGNTFFNKDSDVTDLKKVFEPYNNEPYQLLDMMEQLDKWLLSEQRPDLIIESYNLIEHLENPEKIENIKSLVSLELLLTKYHSPEEAEDKCKVLRMIKELRVCKAHYKDLTKTYTKYGLTNISTRDIYKRIMQDLEDFLEWLSKSCEEDLFHLETE